MPSSIQFSPSIISKPSTTSIYTRPAKKQKMSVTQTYYLAHSARGKLSKEASRGDHDLRLLVGHANLLDSLMIDLANAEQEQERWFNKSVSSVKDDEEEPTPMVETIVEEAEAAWEAQDAESTDDESAYDEDEEMTMNDSASSSTIITTTEVEDEDDFDDDEENFSELALTRTSSRHGPPELSSDSDSDSDDEHMPPSPPQPTSFEGFTAKQREAIATTSFYDKQDASLSASEQETFVQEGFFLPSRQQPTMIAAF